MERRNLIKGFLSFLTGSAVTSVAWGKDGGNAASGITSKVGGVSEQMFVLPRTFNDVSNGKVYIGKADTDPAKSENQIQVYLQNADGSKSAVPQPISLNSAGEAIYKGKSVKLVAGEEHSLAAYDASNVRKLYFSNMLKYDLDLLTQQLEGPVGAALIGLGQTTLDKILTVNVRQFGAKTVEEDPNFDSQPAFQEAIEYVHARGGGTVEFSGHYRCIAAPFLYTLPFDDGTVSPQFSKTDTHLSPEPQLTMPACLQLYSRCRLVGKSVVTSSIDFGWDSWKGDIDLNQRIGIVARVRGFPDVKKSRMNTFITTIGLDGFDIHNAFIGFLADGVMFDQSYLGHMQYWNCGFPAIVQGADSNHWSSQSLINCYAGIIVGGMWLQRNNVQLGHKWVPPYKNRNDIYALGWCDYLHISNLTMRGRKWGGRHNLIDQFFDKYFYKSENSKRTSDGGRLSNMGMDGKPSDYSADPWRGVAGRAFCLISRYKRGNSIGKLIDNVKIYYSPRVPIWTPNMGTTWYGYIDYAFSERVGVINDENSDASDANDFYMSGLDPINTDQKSLPAAVVEGAIQCQRYGLAGTPYTEGATQATVTNDRKSQVILVRKWAEYQSRPKTGSTALEYKLIIDPHGDGVIMERKWPGRYEVQPLSYLHSDKNDLHNWRVRTSGHKKVQFSLCDSQGNVIPTEVTGSLVYRGGIVDCYVSFTVPVDAASLNAELCISGFPGTSNGTHDFGSDIPYVNIIQANTLPYTLSEEQNKGGMTIPRMIVGCRQNMGKARFFTDHACLSAIRYADLVPGTLFSAVVTYNTTWGMFNSNEGLNGFQG